ncbi:MAG: fibronectin type III domain-containing protein [Thermoplasmata archaeon]
MRILQTVFICSLLLLHPNIFIFQVTNPSPFSQPLHSPIVIVGNENFTLENGVIGGNGTRENPYIIENLTIACENTTAITIKNTTAWFIIRKILIIGNGGEPYNFWWADTENDTGEINSLFFMQNVTNGKILDVTIEGYGNSAGGIVVLSSENIECESIRISGCKVGILLAQTNNTAILNSHFTQNKFGLSSFYATYFNISSSVFEENERAIYIYSHTLIFSFATIYNNIILMHNAYGIKIAGGNVYDIISNIIENATVGILIRSGGFGGATGGVNILKNRIFNATTGILFSICNPAPCWVNIAHNLIGFSSGFACKIDAADFNFSINNNTFVKNNCNGSSQCFEGWRSIRMAVWERNFWSDWTAPDENGDGVVDKPYPIIGANNTTNYDYSPLTSPPSPWGLPQPPKELIAEQFVSEVRLYWKCPSVLGNPEFTEYRVYRGTNGSIKTLLVTLNANTTSYVDTNVTPGITYYYHVTAVNAIGESEPSNTVSATPGSVPSPPQNLTAEVKRRSVVLKWDVPLDTGAPPLTGYNIYRGLSAENKTLIATVDANTTTYVDFNVTPGITYYYHVTAVNAIGESEPSNTVSATPGSVPSPPQNLAAEVKRRSVMLKWDVPLDTGAPPLTAYNIYRGLSTENKTLLATVDANTTIYVDNSVTPGLTYYYHVTAVNAIGESEPSNTVSVTVSAKLFAKILVANTTLCSGEEILLSVVVTYADGDGVENATVSLSAQLPGRFESETGQTDANGTFTTKFVAGNVNSSVFGKVVATVSAEGYEIAKASILLGILPKEMRITVEVDKPEVRVGENFTLVVWVRDENAKGIENASVEICGNGMVTGEYQKLTDGQGRAVFSFSALKDGNLLLQVVANKEGFAEARAGAGVAIKSMPEQKIDFALPLALLLIILLCAGIWVERKVSERQRN